MDTGSYGSMGYLEGTSWTQVASGNFTPSKNGWVRLFQPASDYHGSQISQGSTILSKVYGSRYPGEYYVLVPVIKGVAYTITLWNNGTAYFTPNRE